MSTLQRLQLAENQLSGSLPFSIADGLPNLEILNISANRFSGRIPGSISNLSKLRSLRLQYNSFDGQIPINLGNLSKLRVLKLAANQFTNDLSKSDQEFLTSLTNCKALREVVIGDNPITGELPKSLGLGSSNLSVSLEIFNASACRIRGRIPSEIGNLTSLVRLNLERNDLMGPIPTAVGGLRSLQRLSISGNKLQGSISPSLCNLERLNAINLKDNILSGQLPRCLANIASLREIYLARNTFNSNIPSTFWVNDRIQYLDLSINVFEGPIPLEIGNMDRLAQLDLSGNQLSGSIPSTIRQLENLVSLSLSSNKIQGPIPDSLAKLKALQFLDLSHNHITGSIPMSLETLPYLEYFNVSFNDLTGHIPDEGSFVNFTAEFFKGNKGLCGASRFHVTACKKNDVKTARKGRILRILLPTIESVFVAITIMIIWLWRMRGRKSSFPPPSDLPRGIQHDRISYHGVLHATNNLAEENLIGRGSLSSVYKGIFSNTMTVAVKVFNLDVQGALKSFDTECRIIQSIRHRNFVKVITSCSNIDFKALIMEYMPNGNLDRWLHSEACFLSIEQRLGIMIDVASAIKYLHRDYSYPIVHCDLKPSNILLDEDMVARVSDFGISKLLTKDQQTTLTNNLGTIGYVAPEFGLTGLVSTMVDVYSYGILLIEIFTKKKPTDEMFSAEFTMKSWVCESFPKTIMQIVDVDGRQLYIGENVETKHERCLSLIMGLALECIADSPKERVNMKDVLLRLQKIKIELDRP